MPQQQKLRLAGIIKESIVDGPGLRFVLFTQGCPHHCKGCHNPATHDFNTGTYCDIHKLYAEIKKQKLIKGVTFSGGEPFCQPKALNDLCALLKQDEYHILTYTGFTFEELLERDNQEELELLQNTDILIDGKFIQEQKDLTLLFRGSKNQRILDAKKSFRLKQPIELDL